ncbi:MAG: HEAT repeat domain-containing protein [Spirochaetaceae bacterium]
MKDIKFLAKEKRGFTTEVENNLFKNKNNIELLSLLKSTKPKERTSSATILGKRKFEESIIPLCQQLKNEKALYSKIAIQNALSNIGEAAMPELIKLIGNIGENQHKELPKTIFGKWNYPCARDIAIRTICKIGSPALSYLQKAFENEKIRLEVIDSIGHISFYSKDRTSFNLLINSLYNNNDPLIKWKLIRALSAFPGSKTEQILLNILGNSQEPEFRWESIRSLGLICKNIPEELLIANNDEDENVRNMVSLTIIKISNNKELLN